ncbi:response regulator [Paenibacillus sp. JX-17]|uniref:Response regulator n=1 Tax=Paenibacillus lacisoli TaxID=3064525 RepID=A0ABT9C6V5_9BACL|nr:response regulator [Paenibacillus sp. JX-17]MDO7904999.1 response regulator [Paenibacillus sp. JX-17]
MYKLILVDDEQDVREGLAEQIDWAGYGFEITAIAENGREAVELIERYNPDIVVTDIQMPFMNGLQLAEWIRNEAPMTRIIILTGFDEFEYAQKAVKLHIDEYVLKPFSSQELIDSLLKVRYLIEREAAEKKDVELLRGHYKESLPVLRELFLSSLVERRLPEDEIRAKSRGYELLMEDSRWAASFIMQDTAYSASVLPSASSECQPPTNSLQHESNTQLQRFAIRNIAEDLLNSRSIQGKVFFYQNGVVVLLPGEEGEPVAAAGQGQMLEEIRRSIEIYLKFTVTIGVGSIVESLQHLYHSFAQAKQALDYRMILGSNRIIYINDVESRQPDTLQFDEEKAQALTRSLKVGSRDEVENLVNLLLPEEQPLQVSVEDYRVYWLEMFTVLLKVIRETGLSHEEVFGDSTHPLLEINRFTNIQEAKRWFEIICSRITGCIANDRQFGYRRLVEDAKTYIHQHYADNDMSITVLCNHLHISAGYFSSIFKKETKMTFVSYLMQLRMDTAKELLSSSDLKAFEIAEQVGFADPNYFSFCFRKTFGMTPKEYRSRVRGG